MVILKYRVFQKKQKTPDIILQSNNLTDFDSNNLKF